jgi:hypothetical protein
VKREKSWARIGPWGESRDGGKRTKNIKLSDESARGFNDWKVSLCSGDSALDKLQLLFLIKRFDLTIAISETGELRCREVQTILWIEAGEWRGEGV